MTLYSGKEIMRRSFLIALAKLIIVQIAFITLPAVANDLRRPHSFKSQNTRIRLPSKPQVDSLLASLLPYKRNSALVVAFTDGHLHRVFSYGYLSKNSSVRTSEKTIFEIGSISKLFAGLLLCDLCRENKLRFDDPASKYLENSYRLPEYEGKKITLFSLATHCSGLPRNLDYLSIKAGCRSDEFHKFLARTKLRFPPGQGFLYSNTAYRLLGEVLEKAGDMPLEKQVEEKLIRPLALEDTYFILPGKKLALMAQGYGSDGNPIANSPKSGGVVGGLKSNACDLLNLIDSTVLNQDDDSRQKQDMDECLKHRHAYEKGAFACLGCFYKSESDCYGKLGQTDGFSTCIEFSPSKRYGIVLLSASLAVDAAKLTSACSKLIGQKYHAEWN